MEIVFYDFWRSSAAYRVRIALNLLGLEHRTVAVDLLTGAQNDPGHLARNPQGLVPVLEIDGRVLTQSLAILEYLDETRRAGLLPADPAGRARVRALAYAVAMEIHPICNLSAAEHAVAASGGAIRQEDWMHHFIGRGLAALERLLDGEGGPYCHGSEVTLADLCLVPQLFNARRWGVPLVSVPRIRAIDAALQALPAFAAAHPHRHRPQGI